MHYTSGISQLQQTNSHIPQLTPIGEDFYINWECQLGQGAFGKVYKGYSMIEQKPIAIKHFGKYHQATQEHQREIEVMDELSQTRHPHVMGYYAHLLKAGKPHQGLYLFIEYCSGGNLQSLCKTGISEMRVIHLFKQLLSAMTYINQKKLMHRDLKPENILLDENGNIKVADFGMARDIAAIMTHGRGTPLFSAPEMVVSLETNYSQNCDVWSAGLILYQMLTGRQFFATVKNRAQLIAAIEEFKHPQKVEIFIPNELHPKWEAIIRYMLVYDRTQRPNFYKVEEYFERETKKMVKDLAVRYDYQDICIHPTNSIVLTSTIREAGRSQEDGIQERMELEHSYQLINMLRKYLEFRVVKSQLQARLLRTFSKYKYPYLQNVYKYILMFLSTAAYVSRQVDILRQFDHKQFRIVPEDATFNLKQVNPLQRPNFEKMIHEVRTVEWKNYVRFKDAIRTQLIPKLTITYRERAQEWQKIKRIEGLVDLLEHAKSQQYVDADVYWEKYHRLIDDEIVYTSEKQMRKWEEDNVRAYTDIRLVGNLDIKVKSNKYLNEDYLGLFKQHLENMYKHQLIEFVKSINQK